MRRVLVLAAVVAGALGASAGTAQAAEGATITSTGWWTSVPVTTAPEGGIAVSRGASGPTAVGAILLSVDEDPPLSATVTLTEVDGVGAESAAIVVCPTPNQWQAVAGGPMEDAPKPECDRGSVPLERGDDGTWTADVASLLEETTSSLMFVPEEPEESAEPAPGEPAPPPEPAPPGAPFQVSFEPPALSAPASASSSSGSSSSSGGAGSSSSGGASSTFTADPPPTVAAPTTAPAAEEPAAAPEEQTAVGPSTALPTSSGRVPGQPRPWGQALFFVAVASVAGTAAGVGRRQIRTRRAAG